MFNMVSFKTISVLASGLFMVLQGLGVSQQLGLHDRTFYRLSNSSLVGNVKLARKVKDSLSCSFLCLKHGPFVCLSFNVGKANESGYYTCELSNSERYLEPHKMQEQPSYDYYGTTAESLLNLFRLLPCSSSPCNYGGSCIPGPQKGEFSCQCGVNITVLPFIDNTCNVDSSAMGKTTPVQGVFHAHVGRYTLNFYDAQRICEINGAKLATYNQLYAAWEKGLQNCSLGWLADGTARYPMRKKLPGCGNAIGILGLSTVRNKHSDNFNAWCYTE